MCRVDQAPRIATSDSIHDDRAQRSSRPRRGRRDVDVDVAIGNGELHGLDREAQPEGNRQRPTPTARAALCRDSRAASANRPPASVQVSSSAAQFRGFADLTVPAFGNWNGTS